MDGHDDIAQFGPADDPITIGVVQRENPVIQNKMTDKRERTVRQDNESGHSLAGAVVLFKIIAVGSLFLPAQFVRHRSARQGRNAQHQILSIQFKRKKNKKKKIITFVQFHAISLIQ